jgi:hypothetical protein
MNTHMDLVRELRSLRKGRGVFAGRIEQRVGPTLRATCGITEDDGPVTIRRKLAARLTELAEQLPEDMRLAILAAFALTTEARQPLYRDRVYWAATRIDRDPRTVRRRVDDAIDHLAELSATTPHASTGAWHTAELRVAVGLDHWQPEIQAEHRIVADHDGLQELGFAPPFPVAPRDLDVKVLYGGTLRDRDVVSSDRTGFALALPETLAQGESHNFAVRFRLPSPHAMRPYLVYVPEHPCELFDLRVRFGPDRRPSDVWTLRGEHQDAGADPVRHGDQHPVDRAGEIHLRFHRLVPGLAYGAQWETAHESTTPQRASPSGGAEEDLHVRLNDYSPVR